MTVHYNVALRLGAAVRQVAQDAGVVLSPGTRASCPGAMRVCRSAAQISLTPGEVDAITALAPEEN